MIDSRFQRHYGLVTDTRLDDLLHAPGNQQRCGFSHLSDAIFTHGYRGMADQPEDLQQCKVKTPAYVSLLFKNNKRLGWFKIEKLVSSDVTDSTSHELAPLPDLNVNCTSVRNYTSHLTAITTLDANLVEVVRNDS